MNLRLLCALSLLVTAAIPAYSGDKTKSVKLTVSQALSLHCALAATKGQDRQPICLNLETYDDVVKEGDRERVIPRRYQYKPGVIGAMAKNILALQYVTESFNKERTLLQEKIITFVVAPDQAKQPEEFREYQRQITDYTKQANALADEPHEFNLFTFSDAELDTAKNPFPASVLAIINPIRE